MWALNLSPRPLRCEKPDQSRFESRSEAKVKLWMSLASRRYSFASVGCGLEAAYGIGQMEKPGIFVIKGMERVFILYFIDH